MLDLPLLAFRKEKPLVFRGIPDIKMFPQSLVTGAGVNIMAGQPTHPPKIPQK